MKFGSAMEANSPIKRTTIIISTIVNADWLVFR